MSQGNYRFKPGWFATIITMLAVSLFLALAYWQWQRAQYKENQVKQILEQNAKAPLELSRSDTLDWPQQRYRMVQLQGTFEYQHEILLDNVIRKGKPGYHVLTPLRLQTDNTRVLVNRGWVSVGRDRNQLPMIPEIPGVVQLQGRLDEPPEKPPVSGSQPDLEGNHRWAYFDMPYFKQQLAYPIADFVVRQTNETSDNLQRELPAVKNNAGMHIGYMLQWLAFALIAFMSYIKLNWHKNRVDQ